MSWFLGATLSNALIAAVMAIIVVAVSRYWRHRPAVIHAMWLIVLLKFVTPPMVNVPLSIGWSASEVAVTSIDVARLELPDAMSAQTGVEEVPNIARESMSVSEAAVFLEPMPGSYTDSAWNLTEVVLVFWLIGTVAWMSIAFVRIVRFSRLLTVARHSDYLATIGDRVARRIGLKQTPAINVIDARIGPLVWPVGFTPKIVLPAELVLKSTVEQLELVLAHEMAHVKRGDHWVHWFTLVVLAAYWWHPMAWLAVRRLRVAEEQCCDAMVVASLPGCALPYANALVQTLDLLGARHSPPVLASGIDSGGSLKGRCEMILDEKTTIRIGRIPGFLLLLAVCVLPVGGIALADDEVKKTDEPTPHQTEEKEQRKQVERAREIYEQSQNAAQQLRKDLQQLDDESRLAAWHKSPRWHAKDCAACHHFGPATEEHQAEPKPVGISLDVWGRISRQRVRVVQLQGARQGLRNLGFDDQLIETLIKDRTRAENANQVLQNILKLTAENQQPPEQGEPDTGKE